MRIYHLYIYDLNNLDFEYDIVHESEIAAQSNKDALDAMLFVLEHHAKCDDMEFSYCRLFDVTDTKEPKHLGTEIASLYISSSDMRK